MITVDQNTETETQEIESLPDSNHSKKDCQTPTDTALQPLLAMLFLNLSLFGIFIFLHLPMK